MATKQLYEPANWLQNVINKLNIYVGVYAHREVTCISVDDTVRKIKNIIILVLTVVSVLNDL